MTFVKEKLRVAIVGLGHRGTGMMQMILGMPDVEVVGISDLIEHRLERGKRIVKEKTGKDVQATADYQELLKTGDLDAVFVFTSWQMHTRVACDAMRAGVYVATEVGGASSLEECWNLVRASEETGMPCMMLENVNYGQHALALINMVRQGLFGELIHCAAGYQHDLRDEIGLGREIEHYRFDHFRLRNAELYPTHGLGPMAKILDINRGNRFLTLTSTATKACGMESYYANSRKATNSWVVETLERDYKGVWPEKQENYDMIGQRFAQGDVVTTVIKCAGGQTITLYHDCTLARPRLSNNRVQGTKGIWSDDAKSIYFDGISPDPHKWEEAAPYFEKYNHPLWLEHQKDLDQGGHGGIDFIVVRAFVDAVKRQVQTPIDVYDTASWMAVTALSEQSIAMGGHPVAFPDFTSGLWVNREPVVPGKYALDYVHTEYFE
nr:Gfo/Idh/MocA family oxidoreductase [bacterium]